MDRGQGVTATHLSASVFPPYDVSTNPSTDWRNPMVAYIVRRLLQGTIVVFIVSLITLDRKSVV